MILYKYIKIQLLKDHTEDRALLTESLLKESPSKRYIYIIFNINHFTKLFFSVAWALTRSIQKPRMDSPTGYWMHNAAKETLQNFIDKYSIANASLIEVKPTLFFLTQIPLLSNENNRRKFFSFLRITSIFTKRYPLYVSARMAEMVLSYLHKTTLTSKGKFLISTESNPEALALFALSQKKFHDVAFIAHSPYIDNIAPIDLDLGVFWGRHIYKQIIGCGGSVLNTAYIFNNLVDHDNIPKKSNIIIIALSKNTDEEGLEKLISQLSPFQFLIKPHPNNSHHFLAKYSEKITSSNTILDCSKSSRYLIAGNSTVHLEAIANGMISVFSELLDKEKSVTLPFLMDGQVKKFKSISEFHIHENHYQAIRKEIIEEYFTREENADDTRKKISSFLKK